MSSLAIDDDSGQYAMIPGNVTRKEEDVTVTEGYATDFPGMKKAEQPKF